MIGLLRRYKLVGVLGVVCLFGTLFVLAAFLHSVGLPPGTGTFTWKGVAQFAALFGALGALYGSVAALDRRSGMAIGDHPFWRTVLAAIFGAAAVLAADSWTPGDFNVMWTCAGLVAGGVLGWFGWRWARYVDF